MKSLIGIGAMLVTVVGSVAAQEPQLGSVDFPTSASGEAQAHFIRGVLFLHSFEFDDAADAFREAQEVDPDFAMAYWGEALTFNHPLWGEWDDVAARAVLQRLGSTRERRRAKAPSERERMYLDAVEVLWDDGAKAERDTAYSHAMADLTRAYPDDVEAKALYALSLMGLSGTVRVVPTYMRAGAIALEILRAQPEHPGAAHYVIHAFDDPTHAPIALPAARAYSKIAPDAAHAQHMTTHIFVAMGMWDEVVSQNIVAADLTWWGPGHYTSWLTYGLVQQGRFADAERYLVQAYEKLSGTTLGRPRSYMATMRAHHVINTGRWDDPSLDWDLDLSGVRPMAQAIDAFVQGYAAVLRGEPARAEAARAALADLTVDEEDRAKHQVLSRELEAMLALRAGDTTAALTHLDRATSIEDALPAEYGPPVIVKPSHELLGEVLLQLGRFSHAQRAFERALALAPMRARSLVGLAHAASRNGDDIAAARAHTMLKEIWHSGDAGPQELGAGLQMD